MPSSVGHQLGAVVGGHLDRHDLALEAALVGRAARRGGATRTENRSLSSRLMLHFSAMSSAEMPCGTRFGYRSSIFGTERHRARR